jgi:hypothetical protein
VAADVAAADAGFPAGLVAWFPMDTGSGAIDVVGGADATCNATCPPLGSGHAGSGLHFDGTDECLSAPASALSPPEITVAIWVRQDADGELAAVSKRVDVAGNILNTWELESGGGSAYAWTTDDGGTSNLQILTDSAFSLGAWHHLAGTFDGANRLLYVDGVQVAAGTMGAFDYDAHPIEIGCDDNSGDGELFSGDLDELQIYDRALSGAEIAALAAR